MPGRHRFAILVTLVALVVSGCGSNSPSGTEGGAGPSAGANDVNPTDREQLAEGGTLRWPIGQLPPNFNTGHLDGSLADNSAVMGGLLGGPFDFDAAGQPVLNTDYVESAELTAATPKQVVTYRINPKAQWYDDAPITWVDYEAQWKARNGTNPAYRVASTQGYDKIESVVRGSDDREAVVTFHQPYADWKGLFGLYPASTNRDPAVFNDGWKDRPITTAGPFKLEGVDRTAQIITMVRNEKWWGRPAKLERIIYRVINPDAQIDALTNGEVDFVDVGPDVNKLRRAETTPGITLRKAGGGDFRHLTMNGQSEILKDINVRRALAMAINREQIARTLLGPLGVPAVPLNNHIFMPNQKGYQDNSGEVGKHDPEKAKSLLDAAGWTPGPGGVRMKGGKPLTIRFLIPSQVATSLQEVQLIERMLQAVGAKVEVQAVPTGDFFDKYVRPGNYEFTVFSWLGGVFPVSGRKSIYAKPKGDSIQQNYARVGSDELDALFDRATAEFDADKHIALGNQIDTLIWEEVHSLTTYQRPEIVAANSKLANFGAFGFASAIYEDIGFKKG
ncbi:MAG TPA: ABC transporter family substrate-binding protein [Acidimicrobiia bacterium]|nr:ABC transporter family substrate-binding protein [Acidimicrobiia bacterium]